MTFSQHAALLTPFFYLNEIHFAVMAHKFTLQERVDLVLLRGMDYLSLHEVCDQFMEMHPDSEKPSPNTVNELVKKFKNTGSVADAHRCGRPKTASDVDTTTDVLAMFNRSLVKSIHRTSEESHVSKSSIHRILHQQSFHAFKIPSIQDLNDDDYDRRTEFAQGAKDQVFQDETFPQQIIFSDEVTFHLNGHVNRHNCRYWSDNNPHWYTDVHSQHDP